MRIITEMTEPERAKYLAMPEKEQRVYMEKKKKEYGDNDSKQN